MTVKNINWAESLELIDSLPDSVVNQYKILANTGWQFYIVNSRRGICYYHTKTITIPLWAKRKGIDYYTWYFCHEMAHAFAGSGANHGPQFMAELKRLCPMECIHYEITYKPRNAIAAGISQSISLLDI